LIGHGKRDQNAAGKEQQKRSDRSGESRVNIHRKNKTALTLILFQGKGKSGRKHSNHNGFAAVLQEITPHYCEDCASF